MQTSNQPTSDTPETDGIITRLLRETGSVGLHNCPEKWVLHARKLERERDRMQTLAGELIAMIRVNVMRSTFDGVTLEQVDEHLKPLVERLKSK